MRPLFRTFDAAWRSFLERTAPLDDFFDPLPASDAFLLVWLIPCEDTLVAAVQAAQAAFSDVDWVVAPPDHFLHTSLGGVAMTRGRPTPAAIGDALAWAERAWRREPAFELTYRRINCFHTAVVVEVEGSGPRHLVEKLVAADYWSNVHIEGSLRGVDPGTFLAHITIGLVKGRNDPEPLREALTPVRELEFGRQHVREATLCVVPASKDSILTPWDVVGIVAFA